MSGLWVSGRVVELMEDLMRGLREWGLRGLWGWGVGEGELERGSGYGVGFVCSGELKGCGRE